MGLNSSYVVAPSLEMYFVDKDDGLPLANGKVFFYKDNARSVLKPVYELSGTPPNYSYTALPNPCILSAVGTFQDDDGNNILPYYYPFNDVTGEIELYFIEVRDEDDVLQFTREGWPNFTEDNVIADQDITNFVPNGQFILHDNVPASTANSFQPGVISQAVTEIAQGGWTFERDVGSTATDTVTFPRYDAYETSPTGNPRYAVQIQVANAQPGNSRKDLCLKFPNVNQFGSPTQKYNLYFEAQSVGSGTSISGVQIFIIKNYGTGGSNADEIPVTTIDLTETIEQFNVELQFGTNAGKTIGALDDDYVQVIVRLPPTTNQTALFTNFAITINNTPLTQFPIQTRAQQVAEATAGWLSEDDYDGYDLYLPLVLTKEGVQPDDSLIGKIFACVVAKSVGELDCDGAQYRATDYSSDGIPYARLRDKLFDGNLNAPSYGTGADYATAIISSATTNRIILLTNKAGAQTNPADGSTATTFTFQPVVHTGASTITINGNSNNGGYFQGRLPAVGAPNGNNSATIGTTAFTLTNQTDFVGPNPGFYSFLFSAVAAAGLAGQYIRFSSATVDYYMWFKVDAVGGDPFAVNPGRTGIQVNLLSAMSNLDVAIICGAALNQAQINAIDCVAASSIAPGAFFTFNANSNQYQVWYQKNGLPVDPPAIGAAVLQIKVALEGSETNAQVATATQIAINQQFFAVPDLRGMFLRGTDATGIFDPNTAYRYGAYNALPGHNVGSFQLDQLLYHDHQPENLNSFVTDAATTAPPGVKGGTDAVNGNETVPLTSQTGGAETRPVNSYVNWIIKY